MLAENGLGPQGDLKPPQWETVNFPGSLPLETLPVDTPVPPQRETELLNLIRDLNRCNEVLLGRVNQLEESLETSQQALQAEVEHHHSQGSTGHSVLAAQQHSTAQLLSELESSSDALKRQRILSETLQAQLNSSQERVTQLERECTLLQKQHTVKSHSLQESEETCRDLRSRLQRQQRYTLQFKVALEKCLDMSAPQQEPNRFQDALPLSHQIAPLISDLPHNPVSMPRADRIQPWSSLEGDLAPDPQLAALLKAKTPQPAAPDIAVESPSHGATTPASADTQLWQDLERVVEQAPAVSESASLAEPAPTASPEPELNAKSQPGFTEPMPWGSPKTQAANRSEPSTSPVETTPFEPAPPKQPPLDAVAQAADSRPATTTWPPAGDAADIQADAARPVVMPEIPLLKMPVTQGASPSPIVHPLRPQRKKLKSLSAVDLPSFPRPPQGAAN
jgi:hypothetical protein